MDRSKTLVEETKETIKEEAVASEKVHEKKISLKKESIQRQAISFVVENKQENSENLKVEEAEEGVEQESQQAEPINSYVSNFENLTISDVKKEIEQQEKEKVKKEKQKILEKFVEEERSQIEPQAEIAVETEEEKPVKKLVIERPNYDFIPEKKGKEKKTKKSKLKTVAVACALAVATVGCVAGSVVIDSMQSSYIELQDQYSLNLVTYLRNISNLNATNSSMDFLETYPEDLNDPSSIGETSNWFDNLTNFIAGIFGG